MLAKKAFARTAAYDAAISNYFQSEGEDVAPIISLQFRSGRRLRYGENPHQKGAVYGESGIAAVVPLQGKQMSYNNYLDLNAAASLIREFEETAAVIVKHNNPCGVSLGDSVLEAYLGARTLTRYRHTAGLSPLTVKWVCHLLKRSVRHSWRWSLHRPSP